MPNRIQQFKRRLIAFILGVIVIAAARWIYVGQHKEPFSFEAYTMGTMYHVKVVGAHVSGDVFKSWMLECHQILSDIEADLSHYQKDSTLSKFNQSRDTKSLTVISKDFETILTCALNVYDLSNGLFDITIAPLVDLWGFGADGETNKVPDKMEIEETLSRIGSKNIIFRGDGHLGKSIPDLEINLSAIAKGYAVDQLAAYLDQKQCENYLIEIGGEVKAKGVNPDGEIWRLGIAEPTVSKEKEGNLLAIVSLDGRALATSGDYQNFIMDNGEPHSHIINPMTGYPIQHRTASVSVVTDSCMWADAYATALSVMGVDMGLAWVEKLPNTDAYFVVRKNDGTFETFMTDGFKDLITESW